MSLVRYILFIFLKGDISYLVEEDPVSIPDRSGEDSLDEGEDGRPLILLQYLRHGV